MTKLYFPGGGFGFWYLLGIYMKLRDTLPNFRNYQLIGCSAGSLICLVSLLKEEYINLEFFVFLYQQAREEQSGMLNTYDLINSLFNLTVDYIDYENLSLNLSNLYIHTTEITFFWGCLPCVKKNIEQAVNLEYFRQLCLSSCQLPFFGRSTDHCCFINLNNKLLFDGMFSETQLEEQEYDQKLDASSHLSLNFPSIIQIEEMYTLGYNSK